MLYVKSLFKDYDNLQFVKLDSNDTWSRDFGGITIKQDDIYTILDFKFNAWGKKFEFSKDDKITKQLKLKGLLKQYSHKSVNMVLEGGSIDSNGAGIILTTKKCLLEKNRNPHLNQRAIEKQLIENLGAKKVLWLENGSLEGDDTNSHIDTLARFVNSNTIVYQTCDDKNDVNYASLKAMENELKTLRDLNNEPFNLIPLPSIKPIYNQDKRLPATYANFLIINGAVLVPFYNDKNDDVVLEIFKKLFPSRDIIAIDSTTLIKQHGSLHCVTMQYHNIPEIVEQKDILKTALIQQKYYDSKEKTIKRTIELIHQASQNGAKLVVLQELHQTDYFCKNEDVNNFDLANSYEDDLIFWAKIAKQNNIVLVTSLFEKRAEGLYHNTSVVFETDGSIAGKYRKMHIPDDPGFYEKFYFTPGDLGFEPIQTSVGKLGVLICWDQWFSEASRLMALKGAEILIYPTAIGWFEDDSSAEKQRQLDAWITVQRGHAIQNGIPLISVNRVGFEEDNSKVLKGTKFWGNSFVVGAQGEFLAHAKEDEQILYASIDKTNSAIVRRWWPFLRDRRIESYNDITKRYID
jgi:N-carbamoylputrescine amidase